MTRFDELLRVLSSNAVEFVVIGGAAAIAHGSARLTRDLDIVYERSSANIERLVNALKPYAPYLRGAPPGLPFVWDAETVRRGLNFTLVSSIGNIDLLGEIPGGGSYAELAPQATVIGVFGVECRCLTLRQLIRAKRAAGRPKDFDAIAELEAIEEESRNHS